MRIGEVIGKLTLSQCHPSLIGARWTVTVPLTLDGLNDDAAGRGEAMIVFDELMAHEGANIAISEGAEAAAPFHPDTKPIDAYTAAILDHIDVINPNA
ncbi:EutN/CcmL family microcompartment protein [Thalassoroseus pseudoceratinae]|uniref:EutN/CcmL family microcompartment protein n=1 Tax=Thalassoroseus pseudoceratinae TaxID=2713176 RepID=UPI00141F6423|nr:EutN/CcmL family microcompartment protein [Thalassoroseus pseudoceratinae]